MEFLRDELRLCSPAHHVSFAAILAERGLAWAGEYADWEPSLGQGASMRQIMKAVWDHACGQYITPDRLSEFEADLSDLVMIVDPDRYAASYAWCGIWLLRLTTRCCAGGAGAAAAVAVARASLHMSAGSGLAEDKVCDWELGEKWDTPNVQAEARLQSKLAQTLRAIPRIGRDTVETLRRDFVA